MSVHIVFVCTGNTCRSPMAATLFKHYASLNPVLTDKTLRVDSAGLHAGFGSPAADGARRAVRRKGLSLEGHRSRLFDERLAGADLILTMTEEHKSQLILNFPQAAERVYTLKEFAGDGPSLSIMDPFGQSDDVYVDTLKEIEAAVIKAVERLANEREG